MQYQTMGKPNDIPNGQQGEPGEGGDHGGYPPSGG